MRFIVDLYRIIIVGFCAIALIIATLIVIASFDQTSALGSYLTGPVLVAVLACLILLVVSAGGIATLISLHDRHAELVGELENANEHLVRIAQSLPVAAAEEARR